jgi:serine/threonine-protein kinase PknK
VFALTQYLVREVLEDMAMSPREQVDQSAAAFEAQADGTGGQLPVDLTPFVGRRRELREAKQRLSNVRLLTLTGPGGVGKTRLAISVARSLRSGFRDGVRIVELADLRDPNLIGHTVAATLGLYEQSPRGPTIALINHLAAADLLLVLDNCEHLVDGCASLVASLLRNCPSLKILATSQQPIGVSGEAVFPVPPLAVPDQQPETPDALKQYDAVALFLDRARLADPAAEVTTDNYEAVARLVAMLDGIPLAIELAAVRMRSLSVDEIVERMSDPYQLLTGGSRLAPARQKTLRASLDWSFEHCSNIERELWSQLSVFSGGFELDAAEAICAAGGLDRHEIVDRVAALVDRSILTKSEGPRVRYQMLETVRQYGEGRLMEQGLSDEMLRRHREWCVELARWVETAWIGPDQSGLIDRLRREHANLRKALASCVSEPGAALQGMRLMCALEPYWVAQGLLSEGRLWLDRLLAVDLQGPGRAKALRLNASLSILQGRYSVAETMLDEARSIASAAEDDVTLAYITQAAGLLATFRGQVIDAVALFESAVPAFEKAGHLPGLVQTVFEAGLAAGLAGDFDRAATWHRRCLNLTEPVDEGWFRSRSLWAMGLDAWRIGDVQRAIDLMGESLGINRRLGNRLGVAWCVEALAWIAASENDGEHAAVLLGSAEAIWRALGMSLERQPIFWADRTASQELARNALGDAAFRHAYERGSRMRLEESVGFALGEHVKAARPRNAEDSRSNLTRREREVGELVADGLSNRDIAKRLFISQRTAEAHVEHILTKLNFSNRSQIAAWLTEHRATQRLPDSSTDV